MPKYIIESPWRALRNRIQDIPLSHSAKYTNASRSPSIKKIDLTGYDGGSLRIFVYLDSQASIQALLASLPLPMQPIAEGKSHPIIHSYTVSLLVPISLLPHVEEVFLALNRLDPFDMELKQELERALHINFGFSSIQLNDFIAKDGIEQTIKTVHEHSPWQSFMLAETYKGIIEQNGLVTEEDVLSYIHCYASVPESDPQYIAANQIIYDYIIGLELELFSDDTQFDLRAEMLKSSMKLGHFEESHHLLPGLCGYGLSIHPFPKVTGTSKDELLMLMVSMAGHINKLNQEMANLKSENDQLKVKRSSASAGFFDRSTTQPEWIVPEETKENETSGLQK